MQRTPDLPKTVADLFRSIKLHLIIVVVTIVVVTFTRVLGAQQVPYSASTLKIVHFNVGNGDATLIIAEAASGTTRTVRSILIDAGNKAMASTVVIPGIRQQGIKALDYLIATHYDRDHRDGLLEVARSIPMTGEGVFYDRNRAWPSVTSAGIIQNQPLHPGTRIPLKGFENTVIVECVATDGRTANWRWSAVNAVLDENAQSIALTVMLGKFRYFIGGDLTGGGPSGWSKTPDIESQIAKDIGEVTVLRVNHHGSVTSSNQTFLATLNPIVAIISTGRDPMNDRLFRLPSRKVLDRLLNLPRLVAVYVTGEADTPNGLTSEDKKKVRSGQGVVVISTVGDGTFQVNGVSYN